MYSSPLKKILGYTTSIGILIASTFLTTTASGMELEPEVLGRYHYDGRSVSRARIHVTHNQNGLRETVESTDGEIKKHEGNHINYVELFDTGNGLPSHLIGDYDFIGDLEPEKNLPGREHGSLVYSDGAGNYYLPQVTQERWRREGAFVGAFISSDNEKNKIRFLSDARILNGETPIQTLPIALYNIASVNENGPHRKEVWKKLGGREETFTITSPLGCSSISGMGTFVPRFVAHDHANEGALRIYNKIEESEKRLRTLDTHSTAEGSIIVLGSTGTGKSTLLHLLAGKQLVASKTTRGIRLAAEGTNRLPVFEIGQGSNTGTIYPAALFDGENGHNRNLVDCPGFGDVSGGEADIVNAFSINHLLKSTQKFKIILTVRESDLVQRSRLFPNSLQQLTGFFQDDDALQRSLVLIVTQQRDSEPIELLREITEEMTSPGTQTQLSTRAQGLLRFLINNPARISSIPFPRREGPYMCSEALEKVEEALEVAEYKHHPRENISIPIDDGPRLLLTRLAQSLNVQLEKDMKIKVSQGIVNKAKNMIQIHQGPLSVLRARLSTFADYFSNLRREIAFSAGEFIEKLSVFVDIKDIQKTLGHMTFLNKIGANVRYEVNNWAIALTSVIEKIRHLATPPVASVESQILFVKGSLIDSSDINTAFQANKAVSNIQVFALNRLYIDQDLIAQEKSVAMISPHWHILSDRKITINLSGINGANGTNGSLGAVGQPGGDGLPGLPGSNGGHFYGKASGLIKNFSNLTINTKGGKGGKGGDGGKGGNGINGKDGDLTKVTSHEDCSLGAPIFRGLSIGTYGDKGTDGGPGKDGGKGGQGGIGGHPGTILIGQISSNSQDRAKGDNGSPGKGGSEGGRHGRHCQGTGVFQDCVLNGYSWGVPPSYQPSRGSANPGKDGVGVSDVNPTPPPNQPALDKNAIIQAYTTYYESKAIDPQVSPFIEVFPGLDL